MSFGRPWLDHELAHLHAHYQTMPLDALAILLGRSECSIKAKANKIGLVKVRRWRNSETNLLRKLYADTPMKVLMQRLGRNQESIYNHAHSLGLYRSPEFLAKTQERTNLNLTEAGKATRIKPGNVPWNKGLGGWCPEGCEDTQFRRGHRPHTWKPIGYERISKDGYLERKVKDERSHRNFRSVHLILWEEANGPLPPGHAVVFKDGNKRNFSLDNLELVSRAELMRRNTRHRLPPELNAVIQLRGVLNRFINKKKSEAHEEQVTGSTESPV